MDYIDTSVLASYYYPVSGSDLAQKILVKCKWRAISSLTGVELSCAIARKVRDRALSKSDAARILALFEDHVRVPYFHMLPVRAREYRLAQKWISKFDTSLRVLDAIHLAVARSHECRLLTADRELALAAKHFRVRCRFVSISSL